MHIPHFWAIFGHLIYKVISGVYMGFTGILKAVRYIGIKIG
jgi:hypothetical protein